MIIQYTARKYDAHQYFDANIFTYVSDPTATITSIWSDASTNSALWYTVNPTSTVWDAGATSWDLSGNVYNTQWDNQDETWNCISNRSNPESFSRYTSGSIGIKSIWENNGQYVACGDSGLILISSDGVNWSSQTSGVSNNLRTVKHWNGVWYVCGHGIGTGSAAILTSTDRVNWTSHDIGIDSSLVDITFNESTLLMVGWTSDSTPEALIVNTSGYDFNPVTYANDSYYYGVHWNGVEFGLVGNGASDNGATAEPFFATSTDFTTWTEHSTGVSGPSYEYNEIWVLDYVTDTWIICSGRGQLQTTTDKITFIDRTAGVITTSNEYPWRITHNADGVVMICGGGFTFGHVLKSIDKGVTWELVYTDISELYVRKAIYSCDWIAVGDTGLVINSAKTTWSDV